MRVDTAFGVAMRYYLSTVSALTLTLFAASAQADEVVILDDETVDLGEVFFLGGLTPVEAENLGRAVSVVTADEIEARGLSTVREVLRALPGVSLNGANPGMTQVRMRGGEANHTLVLIDGVRAAGGDGEYYFSGLEASNIERVEVLRGPQSVVFGSNASSGVINIVTSRAELGRTMDFSVETGSAHSATAFFAQRGERGGLSLSLSHLDDEGYDLSGSGGERDGIRRRSAVISGDFALTEDLTLDFTLRRAREHYEYDSESWTPTGVDDYVMDDATLSTDRDELTGSLALNYQMLDGRLTHRLAYEATRTGLSDPGGTQIDTTADVWRYRLSFGLDGAPVESAAHLLNLMVENQQDTSSMDPSFSRQNTSYALEYRGNLGGFSVQAGARHDVNTMFPNATTWTLAMAYTFADSGVRLHTSAGTGVVNPTYGELYGDIWGTIGNPNLRPEQNQSFDIGVEIPVFQGRGYVDITLFNERLTDEIKWVPLGGGTSTNNNQPGVSTRRGLELSGRVDISDALSMRMSYTYLDAHEPSGSIEIRRPRHEAALGLTYGFMQHRASVSVDLRHVSGNFDTQFWGAYQTLELPAYTTVDISGRYDLTDRVQLVGRVTNLFDVANSESWGYAGRGRAAYVGLRARF
ncbi:TonB-dependent receptor plug domain-containing protein [Pararhodobacter oceanensis]|uniref:TonB-dependent receptor plug domain-containing protein n=1 Tax=Pararhodobacter oceanensis TaxID=2172121 RepID=UPI003A903EE8